MNDWHQGSTNIRRMSRDDIESILTIDKAIGKGASNINSKDLFATDPGAPLNFSFVCELDNQVVGFVIARLNYQDIPFTEVCLIHGVGVDPNYQDRGIGSKLIRELLDHCIDKEVDRVRAPIDGKDTQLRSFFQRLGFYSSRIVNLDKTFED